MLVIAVLIASCGDSSSDPVDAGGLDAGRDPSAEDSGAGDDGGDREPEDSGVEVLDSGEDTADAGEPDAGEPDAGEPDRDHDGIPDIRDCGPDDDTIGGNADRPCATACGEGVEACTEGTWSSCTAPTGCLCDTPDATRLTSCGNCGMQSERCADGVWTAQSSCIGQGPCSPGAVESESISFCATQERLCLATCQWSEWTQMVPAGVECPTPGRQFCRYDASPRGVYRCSDMCRWTYISPCP